MMKFVTIITVAAACILAGTYGLSHVLAFIDVLAWLLLETLPGWIAMAFIVPVGLGLLITMAEAFASLVSDQVAKPAAMPLASASLALNGPAPIR